MSESDFLSRTRIMGISEEGKRLRLYRCTAGKLTIGIGRNIEDCGISDETAEQMFAEDVTKCLLHLHKIFGVQEFNSYSENQRIALLNLMFAGVGTFLGFKDMIAHVKAKQWEGAGDAVLDSLYARQLPERCARISRMLKEDVFPY